MDQTKIESLLESVINIVIGFGVALTSQIVIFPLVGVHVPIKTNLMIGLWMTLVSIIRSYTIRRWFNAGLHKAVKNYAAKLKNVG